VTVEANITDSEHCDDKGDDNQKVPAGLMLFHLLYVTRGQEK